jgi:hypothetical protein
LHWGNGSVSGTTTPRFLGPGYDTSMAGLSALQYRAPAGCTLRNLRVRHNLPAGNGAAIVYTIRINGIPSLLVVSLASTALDGSDLVDMVGVVAGDLIDLAVTKAASVGAGPADILAILEVGL